MGRSYDRKEPESKGLPALEAFEKFTREYQPSASERERTQRLIESGVNIIHFIAHNPRREGLDFLLETSDTN